jgi:uncharacterized protein (DUF488 family)
MLDAATASSKDGSMAGRIYSVGYEGLTVDGLVQRLAGSRVTTLVDVRLNPVSRRPGFSRRQLEAALLAGGIEYIHEKELGNPRDNRHSFQNGDATDGRTRMRAILSNGASAALQRLVDRASKERIAVLCLERDHDRCHRAVITEMVVERNARIDVLPML